MIIINVNFELGVNKLRQLRETFHELQMLEAVNARLLAWIDKNFKVGGLEKRWPPLRPSTLMTQRRQGTLPFESWRQKVDHRITGRQLWIGFAAEIDKLAAIHHEGTGPYVIEPRRAQVLAALMGRGLGVGKVSVLGPTFNPKGSNAAAGRYMIFGKRVNHPGVPQRRLLPTPRLTIELAVETLNAMIAKVANGRS